MDTRTRQVMHASASSEHYTPPSLLDAVLQVLGQIDLDRCSNSHTAPQVPAVRHFTKTENGLVQPWTGRVYLNPPYGRRDGGVACWTAKLREEYTHGHVTEAIALVRCAPDAAWFAALRLFPWCAIRGRLRFVGNVDPAPFPSAVFYLGSRVARFVDVFSAWGDVWQVTPPGGRSRSRNGSS